MGWVIIDSGNSRLVNFRLNVITWNTDVEHICVNVVNLYIIAKLFHVEPQSLPMSWPAVISNSDDLAHSEVMVIYGTGST